MNTKIFLPAMLATSLTTVTSSVMAGHNEIELTLIHMGDVHGHMVPRPNLRSDGDGRMEGGLARMYTKIQDIRRSEKNTLLINTGDTIQGSAEALYTKGQALVNVLDAFGIDAYVPGNWEFVYGTERFIELFGAGRWDTVSANVSYCGAPYADKAGQTVLPPYVIKNVDGIKVGIVGFTTDRGPQVVGSAVTKGFCFLSSNPTSGSTPDVSQVEEELRTQVDTLRNVEQVNLLVMISELGLANNTLLADRVAGIDVILSSDMHEETRAAVVTPVNGTIVVEEGQDGTMLGEMELEFDRDTKALKKWEWKAHTINDSIREDRKIAKLVAKEREAFVGKTFVSGQVNPFNGAVLGQPIDTVLGHTNVGLHRSNFAHEDMAGAVEGTSHDFLTDAFRAVAGSDIGAIRGFRYGTHVAAGPVRLEDLYHYMPIGPMIARGTIKGQALKNQVENPADGSFNTDPRRWTGGWLFGFSGVTFDIDLSLPNGTRSSNIKVNGAPLVTTANYSYASYWYATDPTLINRVGATNIEVAVRGEDGKATFVPVANLAGTTPMDGTEVVAQYLQDNLDGTLQSLDGPRVNLLKPLPGPVFGNAEVQPLRGAN